MNKLLVRLFWILLFAVGVSLVALLVCAIAHWGFGLPLPLTIILACIIGAWGGQLSAYLLPEIWN